MKMVFRKILLPLFALNLCAALFAQNGVRISSASASVSADVVLGDAYNAYAEGDYQSAVFLFRKALADRQNQSDNALYMLIMAGMHSGEYKSAYADAEYFLSSYPQSEYAPLVKYQMGRALFNLEDYDKALIVLGDFCHENPDNMMYASALFWIGECFYAGYNFDLAAPFYERIVSDFPKEAKAVDSKYRLDAINARKREQKLLYMLQETGENYLSSKENYEKALRRYELEKSFATNNAPSNGLASASGGNARDEDDVFVFTEGQEISEPVSVESSDDLYNDLYGDLFPEDNALQSTPANIEESDVVSTPSDRNFDDALIRLKASALEAENILNGRGK